MSMVLYNFMFSISELLLYYCQLKMAFLNLNAYITTGVPKPMWKEKLHIAYYEDAIDDDAA